MKAQKQETQGRLLIYQDNDLAKFNRKILEEIFLLVKELKALFKDIGIPFNQEAFIKTMNEGSTWLFDILYSQATEMFKKMSDLVKASMVDADKLHEIINPVEPIIENIKALLNQVNLRADQLPFEKELPVINNELKEILAERSKRYATGPLEIELFHTIEEFITIANKLEASLAKNGFPMLFTKYTSFQYPSRHAESDHFAFPMAIASYDNLEIDGHAILQINPEFLEDYKLLKGSAEARARELVPNPNYSSKTGEAFIHLDKGAGKRLDNFVQNNHLEDNTKLPKGRWKGMPGA